MTSPIQAISSCGHSLLSLTLLCGHNYHQSHVFDLLQCAEAICLLDDVCNIVQRGTYWSEQSWKTRVWEEAWQLEDVITGNVHIEHRCGHPNCGVEPTMPHRAAAVLPV